MPNAIAILMLGLWPFITFGIFKALPPGRALLVAVFGGYLLLPPPPMVFDLPLIPTLTKENIPSISAFVCCWLLHRDKLRLIPESRLTIALIAVFVFSPVLTALTNMDPVFFGLVGLPGLGIKDSLSLVMQQSILVLPLLMARSFLSQERGQKDLLLAYMLWGLFYSLPMLIEVRLSPQMNVWIYGYFQHSFDQMMRFGGFRPIVFLYHGLWAAFFALMALCATATLVRPATGSNKVMLIVGVFYMAGVLFLCKSVGSLLYAVALLPLILFLPRALKLRLAMLMALLAISYPILKGLGLLPEAELLQFIARYSEERAASLQFRLDNESTLLQRALERPLFGWGSWGRNMILDPVTGEFLTVSDGRWVIVLGIYGWTGFIAEIGLLSSPILLAWFKIRGQERAIWSPYIGGLSLMLAVNLVDLLPNATLTPLTWLIAGTLLGYAETAEAKKRAVKLKLQSIM